MKLECRFCGRPLTVSFCDLGTAPPSNAFRKKEELQSGETFLPLHVYVCNECYLVQLPEYRRREDIFKEDYAYFSSYSDTWLKHAETYAEYASTRFGLDARSLVVEVASNDGYLLRFFAARGVRTLGIEPSANVAEAARKLGIETLVNFFGKTLAEQLASEGHQADLLVGNNVLAHVPDINDFVAGAKRLLARAGVVTMEFPHVLRLIEGNQFDTIYHEHFSYLSLLTVRRIFEAHALTIFDVEELPTHGGSLRIFARHSAVEGPATEERVNRLLAVERDFGIDRISTYASFAERARQSKRQLLQLLIGIKNSGKRIAAYGAAAKGNTLLNYCGIGCDFIDFVADRSPHKQGLFLPGTQIPVLHPDSVKEQRPDFLLILPWNLSDEIVNQMSHVRSWGGKFIVPIPSAKVLD
jgi:2-polyprenyl-3-methyl-5-hydroxy-6-metoxy-1,4-benzoquinol methylase